MAAAAHLRRLRASLDGPTTLGELNERLGREGVGLLVFLVSLPFLQPIPLAGLGTPVGLMLAALGYQLAIGREAPVLPDFLARRRLEAATVDRMLSKAELLVGKAERFARPRWPWVSRRPRLLGAALALIGLVLAVPVFVPLGNPISAAPLALIGLALIEDDGLLGTLGLAGTALTLAYHAAILRLVWTGGRAFAARFV